MNKILLISDAAKEVKVESHVLRYWEDELELPIKRNELGHRYYTDEDVNRFKQIKIMKDQGLQLKAIKMILKDGKLNVISVESSSDGVSESASLRIARSTEKGSLTEEKEVVMPITIVSEEEAGENKTTPAASGEVTSLSENASDKAAILPESSADKAKRLQWLLQQLIRETLVENNKELSREIREGIVKELDYQFRTQEEREEERERRHNERSEEYYKKMDEVLRMKSTGKTSERKKGGKLFKKADKKDETAAGADAEAFGGKEPGQKIESRGEQKNEQKNEQKSGNKTIDLKSRKRKKQRRKFFLS